MCGYDYIGDEFTPEGRKHFAVGDPFDMKAREAVNFERLHVDHPSYKFLIDKETISEYPKVYGVVDKLDTEKRAFDKTKLS